MQAQSQVWIVDDAAGPGVDFVGLQAGIDGASDGDILLVKSGVYPGFHVLGKGLTITGDTSALIAISSGSSVRGLGPAQHVVLQRLGLLQGPHASATVLAAEGLVIKNCAGSVWIGDLEVAGGNGTLGTFSNPGIAHGSFGIAIENASAVVLESVVVRGGHGADLEDEDVSHFPGSGASAARAQGATLVAHACQFRGGDGGHNLDTDPAPGGAGGHGLHVLVGSAHVAGSLLAGGKGGFGGDEGGFGGGCGGGGNGGDGLRIEGPAASASTLDLSASGGTPGGGGLGGCSPGSPGLPIRVVAGGSHVPLAGPSIDLALPSPLREGEPAHVGFAAAAGWHGWIAYSATPAAVELPGWIGVLVLAPPAVLVPLGVLPAGGSSSIPFTPGELGAGIESVLLRAQVVALDPATLQVTLGAPSALVLLDAGL
ncbi:MAG: hypothetical protein FJ299_04745 [Planctomycetes bacterium]|nr:hypothetical protein [Planctomycetota bacterium]